MKNLYLKIIEKFKDEEIRKRFTDKQLSFVKHVDLYKGQDYNTNTEAHLFPALYVKWSIDYSQNPPSANYNVRLAWEQLRDTSSLNSNDKSLDFIDFVNLVDQILKEIETQHTSKFTLLSEELNAEDTIVDTYSLNYRFSYTGKTKTAVVQFQKGQIENLQEKGYIFEQLND
ncbi:hypothetical protein [Tenacibaculum maritimum]|uniref:hypothetical protein n=1 Tax=Tenacibaculum maritimum TaxID=107401 RepID=UPI0012E55B95|nr:hypothetical protein [Tenacibaculum maritimum]CAA0159005.1 conserved hypothetical protein [Tenacibaculum maritimum]